ncbi:hypothetical protein BDY24DRAFT_383597 [Mrakia frigida]|uniref:uncharacterized protein n=1 Tax=Mrakia frigida TaxID=29902 RepID=UPI003FCBEE6E
MSSLRRRLLLVFLVTFILAFILILSSTRLDEAHPLSSTSLKSKLLPPSVVLLPPPPLPPPEEEYIPPYEPPLHNATHWLEPTVKNATDPYGIILERLDKEFPHGPEEDGAAHPYEALNRKNYQRIRTCLGQRSTSIFVDDEDEDNLEAVGGEVECPESVFSIALLFTNFYGYHPGTRGEDIQCTSVIESLTSLDFTFFILPGWRHDTTLLRFYSVFQNLAKVILIEDTILQACLSTEKCVQTASFPEGPPLSIFLTSSWWGYRPEKVPGHPFGNQWVMTPYQIPDHSYLGYSIERGCTKQPFIPTEERDDTAVILAKEMSYFYGYAGHSAYPHALYSLASTLTSLSFLLFAPPSSSSPAPPSLQPLGHLPQSEYALQLSKSRVLVGIGFPGSSPSPYYGLCSGVPFVNPMREHWNDTTESREEWWRKNNIFEWQGIQHGPLGLLGEPYVYTIPTTHSPTANLSSNALIPALLKAKATPIGRFIPDEMKEEAMFARVKGMMLKDWREEGRKVVKERGEGEESELIKLWLAGIHKQNDPPPEKAGPD